MTVHLNSGAERRQGWQGWQDSERRDEEAGKQCEEWRGEARVTSLASTTNLSPPNSPTYLARTSSLPKTVWKWNPRSVHRSQHSQHEAQKGCRGMITFVRQKGFNRCRWWRVFRFIEFALFFALFGVELSSYLSHTRPCSTHRHSR